MPQEPPIDAGKGIGLFSSANNAFLIFSFVIIIIKIPFCPYGLKN
jgi:hypothetical protein